MGCKLLTRPYCGTQLNWWILQDECDPARAPDVVVQEDPSFSPLATAQADPALLQLLKGWDSSSSLEALISILLGLYAEHNKARIAAAVTDERILFELSMLDEIGCKEVLLTGGDGSPQQARFALPVPVDFAPAQQLLSCLHKQQQLVQGTQEQPAQQQTVAQQLEFMLTVSFPVTAGGSSSHIPVLQLKSPSWFTSQLPALTLPAWDPHTSLLEYLPHLAERVTKHLADHCPTAANRFLLFEGLSRLLGPPLELNMSLLQASSSSSSARFGAAAGLAGAWQGRSPVAAGSAAGLWHVLYDSPLLLFVELPRNYPSDAPSLCLQNLRRTGSDSCVVLQNLPWSPRWPVDEQVARLFNFIKAQAPKASLVDNATAAGAVGTSPAAPVAGGVAQLPSVSGLPPGFYP